MIEHVHEAELRSEAQPHFIYAAPRRLHGITISALILVGAALCCHLLYSPLGLNPTDDGLQLAFARRVLDAQIPHRDFFSVRTPLSYYLWAPVVALGGDSTFLACRALVWFQWATIAWLWSTLLLPAVLRRRLTLGEQVALGPLAFFLSVHTFPIMAWHTIDGLFLASLGLAATRSPWRALRSWGWLFVGLAPLCKQSFVPAVPLLLLLSPDRRRVAAWFSALLPAAVYGIVFSSVGASDELRLQLAANRRFLATAFLVYPVTYPFFTLVVVTGAAWILLRERFRRDGRNFNRALAAIALVLLGTVPPVAWLFFFMPDRASIHAFGALLGLTLGGMLAMLQWRHQARPTPPLLKSQSFFAAQALVLAWCTAISVATNYPALAAGPLLVAGVTMLYREWVQLWRTPQWRSRAAVALVLLTIPVFHWARTHKIYREAPASELTEQLDGRLAGARGIRTNRHTARMLTDLRDIATSLSRQHLSYGVLPDCAAWWVQCEHKNPLPVLWDNEVELPSSELRQLAIQAVEAARPNIVLLVTRYETDHLAFGLKLLTPRYPLTQYVREHWTKMGQSEFFEIYR
jgi:hypothetical protein